MMAAHPSTKVCCACGEEKPLTEFYRSRDRRYEDRKTARRTATRKDDGYKARCKVCHNASKTRAREYRQTERQLAAERAGKPYQTTEDRSARATERREEMAAVRAEREQQWQARRAELILAAGGSERKNDLDAAKVRLAYPARREKEIARVARYKRRNTDRSRAWGRTRRQRELAQGDLTASEIREIRQAAEECTYCGTDLYEDNRSTDHMDPLALGGAHTRANVVACCRRCNEQKADLPFEVWLTRVPTYVRLRALRAYGSRSA